MPMVTASRQRGLTGRPTGARRTVRYARWLMDGGAMVEAWDDARGLFETARAAAQECERTRRMLRAMEDAEGATGGGMGARVSRGSVSDPMRRVDARIDKEALWQRRIEDNERVMDRATCVLYGAEQDGRGGIDAALGSVYADVLWWRYLAAESWDDVARMVGYSPRRCAELQAIAFDYVDSVGVAGAIRGDTA